uniref:Lipid/polyisoprenoid-binding YceI-like domain-containing protein n=1 Tax=Streptomyces sp. WAC2288 TaxID=1582798 RepID=A0A1I9KXF6_9ACTN|nr:hypothetical protein [Streptomyces sp. WAC2288]
MDARWDHVTTTPQLGRYEIDTGNSWVTFMTRRVLGLVPARGSLAIRTGTIDIAEPLTDSSLTVEFDSASLRTGSARWDRAMRSARYLDADRHPVMTFVSQRVERRAVHGMFTVGGVSRPVSVLIEDTDVTVGVFTAHAAATLDRTEFGLSGRGIGARRLDVLLQLTCVHV